MISSANPVTIMTLLYTIMTSVIQGVSYSHYDNIITLLSHYYDTIIISIITSIMTRQTIMTLLWHFYDTIMTLLWHYYDNVITLLWQYYNTNITIHLESCTPGQDWANRYILVRTSTYRYNTVQGSTRILQSYVLVCTGTYQYVHSRRQVVSWLIQKDSEETR